MFEGDRSAVLIEQMRAAAREQNRAIARQLVAIGALFEIRRAEHGEEKDYAVDTWAEAGAEVAAALRCSVAMAGSYMHYARAMGDRLPTVGAVFEAGDIDYRTFQTIVYRTELIKDPQKMALADRRLAISAARWGSMSQSRLNTAIDRVVRRLDEDAVRRKRENVDNRAVVFWADEDGMTGMSGLLFSTDADVLDDRLDALAESVCPDDPRTREQRRADALGALGAGQSRLSCRCEGTDCPAGGQLRSPVDVTIHVVAEQAALDGRPDATAYLVDKAQLIPAELLAELAREARLRPLVHPAHAAAEPGYAPSRALADFVRCRDLTCRAPGCDQPAMRCDIDHTIAHRDGGATHASNLKCLCRFH